MYKPYLISGSGVAPGGVHVNNTSILNQLIMRHNATGGQFRKNTALRQAEWLELDEMLIDVTREDAELWGDLVAMGLVKRVSIGKSIDGYEKVTDAHTDVHTSMDGRANKGRDRPDFEIAYVPVPVHHVEWQLNARTQTASMERGEDLETTNARAAMANLYIHLNNLLVNGGFSHGGLHVYGLTNHPDRQQLTITAADWNGNSPNPENIIEDVVMAQKRMDAIHRKGPFILLVSNDMWANLTRDYSLQKGDNTIMQRILAQPDISSVKKCDQLESGQVVMFKPNMQTITLVIGLDIQNFEMDTQPFNTEFMTACIASVQIKSDANEELALVHMTE